MEKKVGEHSKQAKLLIRFRTNFRTQDELIKVINYSDHRFSIWCTQNYHINKEITISLMNVYTT
jgi:hypothetical protein